jgi:hypothetical protein
MDLKSFRKEIKQWPSAILAEYFIALQRELKTRADHQEELSRSKDGNPEQKPKKNKARGHRPPPQRRKLQRRGKLDSQPRK